MLTTLKGYSKLPGGEGKKTAVESRSKQLTGKFAYVFKIWSALRHIDNHLFNLEAKSGNCNFTILNKQQLCLS